MNIAVDIDDTLTDTFAYLQPFVAEFFGAPLDELRKSGVSYSNLPPEWLSREGEFGHAYYDRVVPDTPFKPGAREAVAELHRRGHRVVIITARTRDYYRDPLAATVRELENGGIAYDKLVCTLDKAAACRDEEIDVIIDDSVANCRTAADAGATPILFTSPANAGARVDFRRVSDWKQALAAIEEIERESKK